MPVVIEGAAASSSSSDAPDWGSISRDILCPLCDYNLRGLIEPRCPECGHRFEWKQVLAQGDPIHPFLYEHQAHRPVWSFLTTLGRSLFPQSFWKTVLSIHRPVVARLIRYWTLLLLPGVVLVIGMMIVNLPYQQAHLDAHRRQLTNQWNNPSYPYANELIRIYGSIQAAIDQAAPPPTFLNSIGWMFRNDRNLTRHIIPLLGSVLLWPWFTLASLLIFRMSLAQARIKTGHVLRCVIYTQDLILIALPLAVLVLRMTPDLSTSGGFLLPDAAVIVMLQGPLQVLPLMLLITTWRLWRSYHHYLRFPHALATAVASQVIVGLALLKCWITWLGM